MFGERSGLQVRSSLRFEAERIVLGSTPAEGIWRLLVDRPDAGPDVSDALDAASPEALVVTLPLPARGVCFESGMNRLSSPNLPDCSHWNLRREGG